MNNDDLNRMWDELLVDVAHYRELDAEHRAAIGETLRETELDNALAVNEFLAATRPAADGGEQLLALSQHSVQPWLLRNKRCCKLRFASLSNGIVSKRAPRCSGFRLFGHARHQRLRAGDGHARRPRRRRAADR